MARRSGVARPGGCGPSSSGCPSGPMTIRVMLPSQASMRARAAEICAPKPVSAAPGPVCGVDQVGRAGSVTTTCGLTVRRIGRCPAARVLSAHCTSASPSCWARVRRSPAGRLACTHRFQHGLHLLPADRVEFEPAGDAAVGVLGDAQRPALGGVGLGAVGVERAPGSGAPPGPSSLYGRVAATVGQRRVHRGQVDALLGGGGPVLVAGDRGDHRDLLGGDARRRRTRPPPPAGAPAPGRCAPAARRRPATAARARAATTASSSARRARAPG